MKNHEHEFEIQELIQCLIDAGYGDLVEIMLDMENSIWYKRKDEKINKAALRRRLGIKHQKELDAKMSEARAFLYSKINQEPPEQIKEKREPHCKNKYTFEETLSIIKENELDSVKKYHEYRLTDKRLPSHPMTYYDNFPGLTQIFPNKVFTRRGGRKNL